MNHRTFALWSIGLVADVSGFNPLPAAPIHRAPQVQPQTAPNGVARPRTQPFPVPGARPSGYMPMPGTHPAGSSFLPPMPASDPALSATQQGLAWEEKDGVENAEVAMQADGNDWSLYAGVLGVFSVAMGLLMRIWPQSRDRQQSAAPLLSAVELHQTPFSTQEMLGAEPVYTATPELRALQGQFVANFQSFKDDKAFLGVARGQQPNTVVSGQKTDFVLNALGLKPKGADALMNADRPLRVSIIGSGNWGSAIARIVGDNVLTEQTRFDKNVRMWVFDEEVEVEENGVKVMKMLSETINRSRENVKYLPGITLPESVEAVPDLATAVKDADVLIWVLPHQFVAKVSKTIKPNIGADAISVSLIKGGIDITTDGGVELCSDAIRESVGTDISVLMGANLASEVAEGQFCEATLGYRNPASGKILQELFNCSMFSVNTIEDVPGVELCGGLKNIVALGAGFSDGLGMGSNTKAALIRLGLSEMQIFIKHFYPEAKQQTFLESCGVADLITTCNAGRNRQCAEAWCKAKGQKTWEQVEAELLNGQKLQGTLAAKEVWPAIQKAKLEDKLPLISAIYRISFEGQPVETLVDNLAVAV